MMWATRWLIRAEETRWRCCWYLLPSCSIPSLLPFSPQCIYDANQVSSLRRSLKSGHQLASHTWSHVHLNSQTHSQIDKQIETLETAMMKIVGVVPAFIRREYWDSILSMKVRWDGDAYPCWSSPGWRYLFKLKLVSLTIVPPLLHSTLWRMWWCLR